MLLARDLSLRSAVDGIGETVLHYLAVENDQQGVAWLASQGFNIKTRNIFGTPAVFEVALLGHRDLLDWFIANGADLKSLDGEGRNIKNTRWSWANLRLQRILSLWAYKDKWGQTKYSKPHP